MKRIIGLSLLTALACMAQPAARPQQLVAVCKVQYQQEEDIRRYTGRLVSPATVNIVARVSGEILEIGFKDGEMVRKGQMLYKLDPVQYLAEMKACEAKVASCKAAIGQYTSMVNEKKAGETYARNDYERNLQLFEKNVVSKDTIERAKREMDVAIAATQAAMAYLEVARAELLKAEADLLKAQDNHKHTVITAPMDGLAGVSQKTAGNYVTLNSGTLVTLIQTTPMRARFAISMNDYLTFLDDNGKVTGDPLIRMKLANGKDYPTNGKLELVDNVINSNTDAIAVYALFDNPAGILFHGGTVGMSLRFRAPRKSLAVLPSCIMHDARSAYVFVVDETGKVARQDVTLGLATTDYQFITSGLKEGQTVIKDGMHKTMPGDTVKTTEQDTVNRE